jgi:hypothetical protein
MKASSKLANTIFIASLVLLVLNDWYLKQIFSNDFTGKLSDFAGLFALPFFLTALFPGKMKWWYSFTLVFFVFWKSALVQPLIDALNHIGLPVHRTIDFTDCAALIVLPFSYYVFSRSKVYPLKPALLNVIACFSALAFVATSMPPGNMVYVNDINKEYHFDFSKHELIKRINKFQVEAVNKLNNYGNGKADFNSQTGVFYYHEQKDTVAVLLDYEKLKNQDTILFKTTYAAMDIMGDDKISALKVLKVKMFVLKSAKGDQREGAIKFFEYHIIKDLEKKNAIDLNDHPNLSEKTRE